jgi:hypothetical protein
MGGGIVSTSIGKYCVHIQLQHYAHNGRIEHAGSIAGARELFREALWEARGWRDDEACNAMVYAADCHEASTRYGSRETTGDGCQCDSACTFHDYPVTMFEIGPRGGVRQVVV